MRAMTDALHGQLYKRASLPKVAPGPSLAHGGGTLGRHETFERSLDHYVEAFERSLDHHVASAPSTTM